MTNLVVRVAAACSLTVLAACGSGRSAEEAAVTDTLMRMFDKPESRLVVGPIAVAGDAALADWTQGTSGGRALLRHRDGAWSVELCAGDGIKNESALSMAGIPLQHARAIVVELVEEERSESPERLARIASFSGVVRMRGGAHPPANESHGGHARPMEHPYR